MEEIWKDIPNYEGLYQASNLGMVRSLDRWVERNGKLVLMKGRILKPALNNRGYLRVCLSYNGKQKSYSVHRLVWLVFNGDISEGYEINHISEDKTDNKLSNLNLLSHRDNICWGTRNERVGKANKLVQRNDKKKSKSVIQKSLQGEVIKVWSSAREIQRQLGYNQGNISVCCRGGHYVKGKWINYTQVYGFIWEYEKAAS